MRKICFLLSVVLISTAVHAQQFIDKGIIEFEVKTNMKKTIPDGMWGDMMKENIPQFKTGIFEFAFSGNKSIYHFSRWDEGPKVPEFMRRDDEMNIYYMDHDAAKMVQQKAIFGSSMFVEDSIIQIDWRLTNESRVIAGFNCRKAIGKIMDSVYVFAFYTDEILIPGGPCSISGLPGMILGMTIPRLYISYIATRVKLNGVNEAEIKPVASKKYNTRKDLRNLIIERAKEWSSDDDENSVKWRNNFVWNALL